MTCGGIPTQDALGFRHFFSEVSRVLRQTDSSVVAMDGRHFHPYIPPFIISQTQMSRKTELESLSRMHEALLQIEAGSGNKLQATLLFERIPIQEMVEERVKVLKNYSRPPIAHPDVILSGSEEEVSERMIPDLLDKKGNPKEFANVFRGVVLTVKKSR